MSHKDMHFYVPETQLHSRTDYYFTHDQKVPQRNTPLIILAQGSGVLHLIPDHCPEQSIFSYLFEDI